jgi:CelD/BcsL family acetyltransferase involved in cellulose biosynthesis
MSPGTILMLWIIRDLIDNTDCEFFDFGMGNHEYKQRYGNTCLNVSRIQLSRWRRPYSLLLVSLDRVLNLAKNFANAIIGGDSKLKQRLRKASRRYG